MYTYPTTSFCDLNITCGAAGKCIPDRPVCLCPIYFDPLSNCTETIYPSVYVESVAYSVASFLGVAVLMVAFALEAVADFRTLKQPLTAPVFYSKCSVLLYGLFKISANILFTLGLAQNTNDYAIAESICQALAISLFGTTYMFTGMNFFTLLLRAKKFSTTRSRELIIYRFIIIGLVATFVPAIITLNILRIHEIGPEGLDTVSTVLLILMLVVVFIIMTIWIVKTFIWYHQEQDMFKESARLRLLRKKTIMITFITIWLIVTSMIIPVTNSWPSDLPLVILIRHWITLLSEVSTLAVIWAFLENHRTTGYFNPEHASSSSRSTQ